MTLCARCGRTIPDDSYRFCPFCGLGRPLVLTNFRQTYGIGSNDSSVFVSTVTSAGKVVESGSVGTAILDHLAQTGTPDQRDFFARIANLASLFEVERGPIQRLVKTPGDMQTIALVKIWLEENRIPHDPDMIRTWEYIRILRNSPPIHHNDEGVVPATTFFGVSFPVDYAKLWYKVLDRFLLSLVSFEKLLAQL